MMIRCKTNVQAYSYFNEDAPTIEGSIVAITRAAGSSCPTATILLDGGAIVARPTDTVRWISLRKV